MVPVVLGLNGRVQKKSGNLLESLDFLKSSWRLDILDQRTMWLQKIIGATTMIRRVCLKMEYPFDWQFVNGECDDQPVDGLMGFSHRPIPWLYASGQQSPHFNSQKVCVKLGDF